MIKNGVFIDNSFIIGEASQIKLNNVTILNNSLQSSYFLLANESEISFEAVNFTHNTVHSAFESLIHIENSPFSLFSKTFFTEFEANIQLISIFGIKLLNVIDSIIENSRFPCFITLYNCEKFSFINTSFYDINLTESANGGILNINQISNVIIIKSIISKCSSQENYVLGYFFKEIAYILIEELLVSHNFMNYSMKINHYDSGIGIYVQNLNKNSSFQIRNSLFLMNTVITHPTLSGVSAPCGVLSALDGIIEIFSLFSESNLSTDYCTCFVITADKLTIKNSFFLNNSAFVKEFLLSATLGGSLILDFFQFSLFNTSFALNEAHSGSCMQMKIKSNYNLQTFLAQKNKFFANYAYHTSNILHIFSNSYPRIVTFEECDFIKGKSDGISGLFYFGTKSGPFYQNYSFFSCNFIENTGKTYGAIIEHFPSNPNNCFLYFGFCNFKANSLTKGEGGLLFDVWGESIGENLENYAIYTHNCLFAGNYSILSLLKFE